MTAEADAKVCRFRQVLRLERAARLSTGDYVMVEYRPDAYHLGDSEPLPQRGMVGRTRDGKRLVTRDGGVWGVDAKERYRTPEDVLSVDRARFAAEDVGAEMLARMASLVAANRHRGAAARLPVCSRSYPGDLWRRGRSRRKGDADARRTDLWEQGSGWSDGPGGRCRTRGADRRWGYGGGGVPSRPRDRALPSVR